jgi:peptidoglycan/LPS O-acetylase OafA/YrhL
MDLMRGVAAVAVVLGHVRGLFFVDLVDLRAPSIPLRAFYLLTGYGHQSVVVFFVLSGFFIGTSVLGSWSRGVWSWERYLLRRLTRLWVVLVPALLLTALLDLGGMHFLGVENVYGGKVHAPMIKLDDARETLSLPGFVGNVFFLQYICVRPYGTDSPLWSLGFEFWSYMLFPLSLAVLARSSPPGMRVRAAVAAAAIVAFGGRVFVRYFGIWLLGVAVSLVHGWMTDRRRLARVGRVVVGVGAACFAVVLTAARVSHTRPVFWDYAAGLVTATFLVILLGGARPAGAVYRRVATSLASFSYTLYVIHYPMIALASAALLGVERWQPSADHVAVATVLVLGVLLVSFGFSRITERHTDVVRLRAEAVVVRVRAWLGLRWAKRA